MKSAAKFAVIDVGSPTPAPATVIEPTKHFDLQLKTLWQYRELLFFLIWREVKVRYKQTLLGAAWAMLQPLATMLIFTVVFGRFAGMPSDGQPYAVFAYVALLPWLYFSQATERSSNSLILNSNLISKVYFPRLIIPLASVLTPVIDFLLAFIVLIGMLLWFGITPKWYIVLLPAFFFVAQLTALGISLWLSALNVKYRDVRYAIPFLIQVWLYASPIAYPLSIIPERWRVLYSLNPMVGVIEGFRWALLGHTLPDIRVMSISVGMVLILLLSGLIYFRQTERTFADIV